MKHVDRLIERSREDDVSATERDALRDHVARCRRCREYDEALARNDTLLARREGRVPVPEMTASRRSRFPWAAAAMTTAALVVVTALAVGRPPIEPAGSVSASPSSSANTRILPSLTPLPPLVGEPDSVTGVRVEAAVPTTARVIAAKLVTNATHTAAELQMWAVTPSDGTARKVFAYDVALGGLGEAILDSTPYLRRGLAPQGTRIVLSVHGQLVVVDLVAGAARRLGVSGYFPSWSKDGSSIAFVFDRAGAAATPERHLGLVGAAGGTIRDLGPTSSPAEWSGDSSKILIDRGGGLVVIGTDGRELRRMDLGAQNIDQSFGEWRSVAPEIAIVAYPSTGLSQLVVLDSEFASPRVVVDAGAQIGRLALGDPRWNPASDHELLYTATIANRPPVTHLIDVTSGRDLALSVAGYEATWSGDGADIYYLLRRGTQPYGAELRSYTRATGSDRVLLRASDNEYLVSLALLAK